MRQDRQTDKEYSKTDNSTEDETGQTEDETGQTDREYSKTDNSTEDETGQTEIGGDRQRRQTEHTARQTEDETEGGSACLGREKSEGDGGREGGRDGTSQRETSSGPRLKQSRRGDSTCVCMTAQGPTATISPA